MTERIAAEIALLKKYFPETQYIEESSWFRLPEYSLPEGWLPDRIDLVFQVPPGYPGAPPYGIYIPVGLTFRGSAPDNYAIGAQPPFAGSWGVLSWTPDDGEWRPTADLETGPNLLNWVLGFKDRFIQGK